VARLGGENITELQYTHLTEKVNTKTEHLWTFLEGVGFTDRGLGFATYLGLLQNSASRRVGVTYLCTRVYNTT